MTHLKLEKNAFFRTFLNKFSSNNFKLRERYVFERCFFSLNLLSKTLNDAVLKRLISN